MKNRNTQGHLSPVRSSAAASEAPSTWTARVAANATSNGAKVSNHQFAALPSFELGNTIVGHFRPAFLGPAVAGSQTPSAINSTGTPSPARRSLLPSLTLSPEGQADLAVSAQRSDSGVSIHTLGLFDQVRQLRGGGAPAGILPPRQAGGLQPFTVPNMAAMDPFRSMEQEVVDRISHLRLNPEEFIREEESSLLIAIPGPSDAARDPPPPPPPPPPVDLKAAGEAVGVKGKGSPSSKQPPGASAETANPISTALSSPAAVLDAKYSPSSELAPLLGGSGATLTRLAAKEYILKAVDSRISHYSALVSNIGTNGASDRKQSRAKSISGPLDPSVATTTLSPQEELIMEKVAALKAHREDVMRTVDGAMAHVHVLRDRSTEREGGLAFCSNDVNAPPSLVSSGGGVGAARLSHGISLAARDLAKDIDYWLGDVSNSNGPATDASSLVRDVSVKEAERHLLHYGRLAPDRQLFGVVVLGTYSATDISVMALRHFLRASDPAHVALVASSAAKLPMGAGWQKHPVFGAVTVVLVVTGFNELLFLKTHALLPATELSRCVKSKQIPSNDVERYDLRFAPESLGIRAIFPLSHPIYCPAGEDAVLVLSVPPGIFLSCVEEKANRTREQAAHKVTASRYAFIDRDGRYLRITARCPLVHKTAIAVYARSQASPQYCHSATFLVLREDTVAAADVERPEFPSATDFFQQVGGMLLHPRVEQLTADEPIEFVIRCSSDVESCSVTGVHGTVAMTRGDDGSPPPSLAASPSPNGSVASSGISPPAKLAKGDRKAPTLSVASSMTPSRHASIASCVFTCRVARPREGSISLWMDGFAALQWTVVPPRVVLKTSIGKL